MDETEEEKLALSLLTPGKIFRMYKRPHPHYKVGHVRAVIDEEYIVHRYWRPGKGWRYVMDHVFYFGLLIKDGKLTVIGNERIS